MASLSEKLNDTYIRFMVWLGAEPPPGYEHLIGEPAAPREYTLQEGETIFSAGRKFGVHYERIAQASGIEAPETVQPGDTVLIPPVDWAPESESPAPEAAPVVPPQEEPEERPAPAPALVEEEVEEEEEEPIPLPPFEEAAAAAPAAQVELPVSPAEPEHLEETAWQADTAGEAGITTDTAPEPETAPQELAVTEEAPTEEFVSAEVSEPPTITEEARPTPVVPEPDQVFRYEVQRGDTINSVARRYGLTVKEIVEANNISDPDRLFPGQKLIIPGYMVSRAPVLEEETLEEAKPRPRPGPDEFFVHTVDVGDTLSSIAKRYGVTVRQIVEINDIEDPSHIRVGQRLQIPRMRQEPAPQPKTQQAPAVARPKPLPLGGINPDFPPLGPLEAARGLYVSYFAIGHSEMRQRIFDLLNTTEFNSVVIDVKGDFGWISYPTQVPLAHEIGAARPTAKDFQEVMEQFKALDVYTIARIVTYKDNPLAKSHPEFAVKTEDMADLWQDREELYWTDPFLRPVWDYNIQIAVEAARQGFDEIQFDFLRFPTQSQLGAPKFSQDVTKEARVTAITGFLSVAQGQLKPLGANVAIRTLGYACWRKDDTLIGHDLERLARYSDVLCPMLYPSTFSNGIPGYKVAVAHPYEVVYESARRAVDRVGRYNCAVRPWIQDFQDYRFDKREFGKEEIQAQIRGCFDAGCTGFMAWSPKVEYSQDAYAPIAGQS